MDTNTEKYAADIDTLFDLVTKVWQNLVEAMLTIFVFVVFFELLGVLRLTLEKLGELTWISVYTWASIFLCLEAVKRLKDSFVKGVYITVMVAGIIMYAIRVCFYF